MSDGAIHRRNFIKTAAMTVASFLTMGFFRRSNSSGLSALGPRVRIPNPYVNSDGKPILVCVNGTDFGEMLQTGLTELGGLGLLIDSNQDVLIKPNMNAVDVYPALSSPDSISDMVTAVRNVTNGTVSVGDQSYENTQTVYNSIDLEYYVLMAGGQAIRFTDTYDVRRESWNASKPDFQVYREVYDSPVIINFPSIKRHFLGMMTCALKCNVGTVIGSGATGTRRYLHNQGGNTFLQEVTEIAGLINPELNVVDARSILTVNGPSSAQGVIKTGINKIILCGDMVATDAYCAQLLSENDSTFSTSMIEPTLRRAVELGLGTSDLDQVEIIETNAPIEDPGRSTAPENFELHQNYPNPLNPTTTIRYSLSVKVFVILTVTNLLGEEIDRLVNREQPAGTYQVEWNSADLPSGEYFCKLQAGDFVQTRKMTVLK